MADPSWTLVFTNGSLPRLAGTNGNIALVTSPITTLTWSLQPTNLVTFEGSTANFYAIALSDSELAVMYQWYIETSPGSGTYAASATGTGSQLSLPVVNPAQSGTHLYVIANNAEGGLSLTSSVVTLTVNQAVFETGFAKEEKWLGLTDRNLIENGTAGNPTFSLGMAGFEQGADNPGGQGDFVLRLSGFFVPPTTGNYVFFVDSDDDSDLFISTDNTVANKRQVAQEAGWS
ncbi:MAG: PA14 domain-containing protein, partial [Limisphaerales bacterium]